jgi:hypothetical protein
MQARAKVRRQAGIPLSCGKRPKNRILFDLCKEDDYWSFEKKKLEILEQRAANEEVRKFAGRLLLDHNFSTVGVGISYASQA